MDRAEGKAKAKREKSRQIGRATGRSRKMEDNADTSTATIDASLLVLYPPLPCTRKGFPPSPQLLEFFVVWLRLEE